MIRFLILALLLALPASADDLRHELERHGLTPEQLSEAGHHAFTSDFFINGAEHSGTSTTSLDANATDPPTFTTLTFLPADIRDQTPPATSFSWDAASSSFILGGLEVAEQFAVRLAWDIDPAADETTCTARLLFTRSATTGNPDADSVVGTFAGQEWFAGTVPDEPVAATGEPIKIGHINQEDVPAGSFPEVRLGTEAAIEFINTELGGADGQLCAAAQAVDDDAEQGTAGDASMGTGTETDTDAGV